MLRRGPAQGGGCPILQPLRRPLWKRGHHRALQPCDLEPAVLSRLWLVELCGWWGGIAEAFLRVPGRRCGWCWQGCPCRGQNASHASGPGTPSLLMQVPVQRAAPPASPGDATTATHQAPTLSSKEPGPVHSQRPAGGTGEWTGWHRAVSWLCSHRGSTELHRGQAWWGSPAVPATLEASRSYMVRSSAT